jgi:predicted metal-binding membrane protein
VSALAKRQFPLAALVLLAALVCWIVAIERMDGMDMGPGTPLGSLPFFLGIWTTMMAAMMLPAALPVVLLFGRGRGAATTTAFVVSYLVVWAAYGLGAYAIYRGVRGFDFLGWDRHGPLVAGAAVAAAGVYELSRLKRACLENCRNPLALFARWRPGFRGTAEIGLRHAAYCVGCCWALFVILFALGVMSITWMLAVTLVVFAQKVLPRGDRLEWPLAVLLVAFGVWIAVAPGSVPGLHVPQPM